MKKLLIAIAAAATAIGTYAATAMGGAGFDSGDTATTYTWDKDGGFNAKFWSGTAGTTTLTSGDCGFLDDARPAGYAVSKTDFMAVKTTFGQPITQNVLENGSGQLIGGDGFYYDGLVKFTACDETPELTAEAYAGAKIGFFPLLESDEDNAKAYLCIWAADATGAATVWTTTTEIDDAWHRVTIKMIANANKAGNAQAAFVVFIDGNAVNCVDAKAAFTEANLTPAAKKFWMNGELFASLVADGTEVTGVLYDGQGSIDEVGFTDEAPEFAIDAQYFSVTYDDTIEKLYLVGPDGTITPASGEDIELKAGDWYYYYDAAGERVSIKAIDAVPFTPAKDTAFPIPAAVEALATVTVGESVEYYADAASAFEAAQDAEADAIVTLKAGVTQVDALVVDSDYVTTLDLAGFAVDAPITVNTDFVITNSSDAVAEDHLLTGRTLQEIGLVAGNVEIYNSYIAVDSTSTDDNYYNDYAALIYSGQVGFEISDFDTATSFINYADGLKAEAIPDTSAYQIVPDVVATAEVTISAGENLTLTVKDADGTVIQSGDEVEVGTVLTITATPDEYYTLASLKVNDADFTSGNTYEVESGDPITIAATASATAWTINYLDNGTPVGSDTYTVENREEKKLLVPEEKTGYTFDGWYEGQVKVESLAGKTGALTLEANWIKDAIVKVGDLEFATAAEALAKVQELEADSANFPIVVTALADGVVVTDGASQTITLAKDETITITADGWEFSGELNGSVALAPGKSIKVKGTTEGISVPAGYGLKATPDGEYTVYTAFLAAAEIDGTMFETIPAALAAAEDGDTVKFLTDVAYADILANQTTKAGKIDFNNKSVALKNLSFTGDCDVEIVGGDYVQYNTFDVTVPKAKNLTVKNMTFYGTLQPKGGTNAVFTAENCTFKVERTKNGKYDVAQDGTKTEIDSGDNTYVSYNFANAADTFAAYYFTGNDFTCGRRSNLSFNGASTVAYIYNNTFGGTVNRHVTTEVNYKFPALQVNDADRIYFEENEIKGSLIQSAFAIYFTHTKVACRANTWDANQNYVWTLKTAGQTPTMLFSDNVYENASIDKEHGIYKTPLTDLNSPCDVDAENMLVLPTGYTSFYAWAKSEDAGKVFVKDAFADSLASAVKDDTVIADPFAELTGLADTLALDATAYNAYTVIDKPTSVTFTVNINENITAASYTINGENPTSIVDGGTIAGVAPGAVVAFELTVADGYFTDATCSGNVTKDGLAFTVADAITNPAVEVNLLATLAFAKAIPLSGEGDEILCKTPNNAWLLATNGLYYVKFLKTIKTSGEVLKIVNGDTARINPNGFDSLYRAASGFAAVVAKDGYNEYTAYKTLAAAWTANGSAATYRLSATKIDLSTITLADANLVFQGEFTKDTSAVIEGSFTAGTEPAFDDAKAKKTDDWGMVSGSDVLFKFAAEATSTDPVPPPAEDTPEAVAAALLTKGITAADVTSKADLAALNAMLTAAGVTDAATLSEGAKAALNSSFLMKDIAAGKIFETEPTITIEKIEATETAGTFEFTVAVKEGATLVQLQQAGAEALAGKVLVGNKVDAISSKVEAKDLTVKDVADGKAVFDIAYGDGAAGFLKINVTK